MLHTELPLLEDGGNVFAALEFLNDFVHIEETSP